MTILTDILDPLLADFAAAHLERPLTTDQLAHDLVVDGLVGAPFDPGFLEHLTDYRAQLTAELQNAVDQAAADDADAAAHLPQLRRLNDRLGLLLSVTPAQMAEQAAKLQRAEAERCREGANRVGDPAARDELLDRAENADRLALGYTRLAISHHHDEIHRLTTTAGLDPDDQPDDA